MLNTVINFLFINFPPPIAKTPLLSFIHTVQIDLSITQYNCYRLHDSFLGAFEWMFSLGGATAQ